VDCDKEGQEWIVTKRVRCGESPIKPKQHHLQSSGGIRKLVRDEAGSVSPLIISYFLITLIAIFIGINLTHAYLERRHLIITLESSLQRATQEIDDWRYYTGYLEQNTLRFQSRGVTTFVPIDCNAARRIFNEEFLLQWSLSKVINRPETNVMGDQRLREMYGMDSRDSNGNAGSTGSTKIQLSSIPQITGFTCDGKTVAADAELVVELPFKLSFAGVNLLQFSRQKASVEVGLVFGG
jgi:hypothetical protein